MVVSAREEASKVGTNLMKKGGNAFDAMIGVELALAVVHPNAGNIGGGGFMVYRKNNGETGSLDYREKAPIKASKNMYLDKNGDVIGGLSTEGGLSVGVPGTIAGIFEVHKKFGTLPISSIFEEVIKLAKNGYYITEKQSKSIKSKRDVFKKVNGKDFLFTKNYKKGDILKQIKLSKTLEKISENGADAFYKGEIGNKLVKCINDKGGIISREDLESYRPVWRKTLNFKYHDLKVISMAPPSSGGITLLQIMKMVENFDLKKTGFQSTKYIQLLTEAERRAYADRNYFLGDPDFVNIPLDKLSDSLYLQNRLNQTFDWNKATPSKEIAHGNISTKESTETTHYSIKDSFGNAVAATTTLNGNYGSKLYCDELGFFLNNEMDDFSVKEGTPNMYGLIGAKANSIEPGKRMLSSMTPTIVEKNNKLYMIVGSPGGSTIITSVLQTILNVYHFDMSMQEAVSTPRFHHQWLPDEIVFEPNKFDKNTILQLEKKGYHIIQRNTRILGKVDAIKILPNGSAEGGADPRGDDTAVGF